jgi:4-carboxymuconolactone decarboxylase
VARQTPVLADEREKAIYDVAAVLMQTRRVPDALRRRGVTALGEHGMVELVGILG